jgi:lipid-binding SYLF domain-containing protein
MKTRTFIHLMAIMLTAILIFTGAITANAETAADIDREVDAGIENLFAASSVAKDLAGKAKAILVFPKVIKAGLLVGAQYGKGALRMDGKTAGYFNTIAASYGLQAGAQSFGYALYFMTDSALEYLKKSSGFELGVGPSIVIVDEGIARSLTTATAKDDIYAFIFSQKGLMAGLGLQGSKITQIHPD